jgi:hypothetical protein
MSAPHTVARHSLHGCRSVAGVARCAASCRVRASPNGGHQFAADAGRGVLASRACQRAAADRRPAAPAICGRRGGDGGSGRRSTSCHRGQVDLRVCGSCAGSGARCPAAPDDGGRDCDGDGDGDAREGRSGAAVRRAGARRAGAITRTGAVTRAGTCSTGAQKTPSENGAARSDCCRAGDADSHGGGDIHRDVRDAARRGLRHGGD